MSEDMEKPAEETRVPALAIGHVEVLALVKLWRELWEKHDSAAALLKSGKPPAQPRGLRPAERYFWDEYGNLKFRIAAAMERWQAVPPLDEAAGDDPADLPLLMEAWLIYLAVRQSGDVEMLRRWTRQQDRSTAWLFPILYSHAYEA